MWYLSFETNITSGWTTSVSVNRTSYGAWKTRPRSFSFTKAFIRTIIRRLAVWWSSLGAATRINSPSRSSYRSSPSRLA